jgi:HK97 family phage major capsid protein
VAREAYGSFRAGTLVAPLKTASQIRPRRANSLTASFVADGAAIPESQMQFDGIGVDPKKLAILGRSSTELWEDEAVGLAEYAASEVGWAMSVAEDGCGFMGDGTSAYSGMSGFATKLIGTKGAIPATAGHDTFAEIDSVDIGNVIAGVIGSALPGAAWYISPIGFAQALCRLAVVTGGLIATPQPNGLITYSYLGWPVRLSGALLDGSSSMVDKPMLFFGDLAMGSVLAERRSLTIATSLQRALDADEILFRATERVDIVCHGGVADPTTGRGPVAMLVGKS